jgi:hypothetical protein
LIGARRARRAISDENLLRYNGMPASVFELLADFRAQIAGVTGAVEATEVIKLLAARPAAIGLAVPGMPVDSPGMEVGDRRDPTTCCWSTGAVARPCSRSIRRAEGSAAAGLLVRPAGAFPGGRSRTAG